MNILLRQIDQFLDLDQARVHLDPFYSHTGRPSIDPELMIRMLLIGYCYGIRSDRRSCEEIRFNLAYRWFCREVEVGPLEFEPSLGSSWTDPILGFRYRQQITPKWDWLARVDAGGFDVGSASKLSYKIEPGASYAINEDWLPGVGFRYLDIDYEDGDEADSDYYAYDGNEYGLLLGVLYKI